MSLNILHITPDFRYACGRSYYVYLLLKYLGRNNNVYLLTNGGDAFPRLDELNIPYHTVKKLKSKNPVSYSKNIGKIKKIINEHNIDIVHTHHRYSELLALQAAKNLKTKTVFTSLSLVKKKYNVEFRSDRIIAVSNTIKNMLTQRFAVNEDKIKLIPNFVDSTELDNAPHVSQTDSFNILAAGRFHKEKNFKILLKALNMINDNSIRLALVGEGNKHNSYRKYIKKHGLSAEIYGPQKNLTDFFNACNVCILPSVVDPFPTFMLHAGLFNKPFIGADVDGIGELITEGENGLLFKSGDAKELAGNIVMLKNNKDISAKCAENLHNTVMKKYTEKSVIPEIQNLYYDVISQ